MLGTSWSPPRKLVGPILDSAWAYCTPFGALWDCHGAVKLLERALDSNIRHMVFLRWFSPWWAADPGKPQE
eukprot:3374283-Pyramimonas_sp.AAC.1